MVVHEDTRTGGFTGEIIATIVEKAFTYFDSPIQRLATPDLTIPYNMGAMNAVLPHIDDIKTEIRALVKY